MWVVSQEKIKACKFTKVWLGEEMGGKSEIRIVNETSSTNISVETVGKYETKRAKELFNELVDSIGNKEKFYMPEE